MTVSLLYSHEKESDLLKYFLAGFSVSVPESSRERLNTYSNFFSKTQLEDYP